MILEKLFGKRDTKGCAAFLAEARPGDSLDLDRQTWRVAAMHRYIWEEPPGEQLVWELRRQEDLCLLTKTSSDEVVLGRVTSLEKLDPTLVLHILEHDDPPEQLNLENQDYHLEASLAGAYHEQGQTRGSDLVAWTYFGQDRHYRLLIEQRGGKTFLCTLGKIIGPGQLTNLQHLAKP